jgi:hypothetical protein
MPGRYAEHCDSVVLKRFGQRTDITPRHIAGLKRQIAAHDKLVEDYSRRATQTALRSPAANASTSPAIFGKGATYMLAALLKQTRNRPQ